MPDILIRDVPSEDLAALDQCAMRVGLTLSEFLRRHLHSAAQRANASMSVGDLRDLAAMAHDLSDSGVMGEAWS